MDTSKSGFSSSADKAVAHVINRMRDDERLADRLGYGTESFDLLTKAYAEAKGLDIEEFRHAFNISLKVNHG
jgi:hypothetical protein